MVFTLYTVITANIRKRTEVCCPELRTAEQRSSRFDITTHPPETRAALQRPAAGHHSEQAAPEQRRAHHCEGAPAVGQRREERPWAGAQELLPEERTWQGDPWEEEWEEEGRPSEEE